MAVEVLISLAPVNGALYLITPSFVLDAIVRVSMAEQVRCQYRTFAPGIGNPSFAWYARRHSNWLAYMRRVLSARTNSPFLTSGEQVGFSPSASRLAPAFDVWQPL